jgi:hypothetical protein
MLPGVDQLCHMVTLCLTFWENSKLFSTAAGPFCIPRAVYEDSSLSTLSLAFIIGSKSYSHLSRIDIISHCVFNFDFPKDTDTHAMIENQNKHTTNRGTNVRLSDFSSVSNNPEYSTQHVFHIFLISAVRGIKPRASIVLGNTQLQNYIPSPNQKKKIQDCNLDWPWICYHPGINLLSVRITGVCHHTWPKQF